MAERAQRDAKGRLNDAISAADLSADFRALFEASPTPFLVVAPPDWTDVAANDARLQVTGMTRAEQIGRRLFDVFPDDPDDPTADGVRNLSASLGRVLATKASDVMAVQRYAVRGPDGRFVERWWSPLNSPVLDKHGEVALVIHRVEDVTELMALRGRAEANDQLVRDQQAVIDRLRASEAASREADTRRGALIQLADAFRDLASPADIAFTAAEILGRTLGVSRVGYGTIDHDAETMHVERDWTAPEVDSLAGVLNLRDFGSFIDTMKRGELDVIRDVRDDPRASADETAALEARSARSFINAPVLERGRLVTVFFVNHAEARNWSQSELTLIQDLAERTRTAVERARGEARLRESEARFRLMTDAVPQIVWIADRDGRMEFMNKQFVDYTGASPDAWTADEIAERFMHKDDGPAVVAAFDAALRSGEVFDIEHRIRSAAGKDRWFLARGVPYRDPDTGKIVRWFGASVDIHDRKLAETRLRELNETLETRVAEQVAERNLLATLVETTDVMIMAADRDYNILAINKANADEFERIYGTRPTVGDNMLDLLADQPEHQAQVRAGWARRLAGEESTFVEDYGEPGRTRPYYEIKFRTLRNEAGKIVGTYQFVTEVTERLREQAQLAEAQDALRQSQKMEAVGQLTGGIAHDFNNLLTGIVGSLDLLQRRVAEGRYDQLQRYSSVAITSAQRAAALTQRLLAFSRRQPLDPKPVETNKLVTSMEDLLRRTLGPSIDLELVFAGGLWPTLCDPNQLESAILNLAINARDAMPDGGRLTIETQNAHLDKAYARAHAGEVEPGQYVAIAVTDTGTGIPRDQLGRIFEPFFTTKPIGQGTGLGLSQLYGFAKQSGGHVAVYSEEGRGTTFRLYLPRHLWKVAGADATVDVAEAPERAGLGETVPVVDDEAAIRMVIGETLEELGYRALEAVDGPSGLRLLQADQRVDLLVTDVGLPGLNGRQLADAARALRPELKVLFITGYAGNAAVGNGVLEHGMEILPKPFTMDQLASKIREIMGPAISL